MARKLWDGNDGTIPQGGGLGDDRFLGATILLYAIKDLNVDGDATTPASRGSRCYHHDRRLGP